MSLATPDASTDRFNAKAPVAKPGILEIAPYTPGKAGAGHAEPIKLSANENILGSSPLARAAFAQAVDRLNMYPDGRCSLLRAAVSERYELEPERLVFGCGSDEIFAMLAQVYLEPGDNIVQGEHAFLEYAIAARANQAEVRIAAEPNFTNDVDLLLAQVNDRTRMVFLANPGNPTGTWLSGEAVRRLQAGLPPSVILVLDGAYAEFITHPDFEDGLSLARETANVVVTRTFSKIHGLAALRVGWAYTSPAIVDALDRIRQPFNVNIPAQVAAIAALGDEDFQARSRDLVEDGRAWLTQHLGGLGLDVVPGAGANFVLVGFPTTAGKTAPEAEAFLASKGLMVRYVANYGLPNHLRITIGLPDHHRTLADALSAFLDRP